MLIHRQHILILHRITATVAVIRIAEEAQRVVQGIHQVRLQDHQTIIRRDR